MHQFARKISNSAHASLHSVGKHRPHDVESTVTAGRVD